MGKLRLFTIVLNNEQTVYNPGQEVSGRCLLQLNEGVSVKGFLVNFTGIAKTKWSERRTRTTYVNGKSQTQSYYVTVTDTHGYFNFRSDLSGYDYGRFKNNIPAGSYEFPFAFHLPASGIPNSFEGTYGHVRYVIKAEIYRPFLSSNYRANIALNVVCPINLPFETLMTQVGGENEKTVCCLWCKSGPVSISAYTNKTAFMPGEDIKIKAHFENNSTRRVTPVINLHQMTVFNAGSRRKQASDIILTHGGTEIAPGRSSDWDVVNVRIPQVWSTIQDCILIRNEYFIRIKLEISGANNLNLDLPIIIGLVLQPPQEAFNYQPPQIQYYPSAPALDWKQQEDDLPPSYDQCI